jgi:hypothetical protein
MHGRTQGILSLTGTPWTCMFKPEYWLCSYIKHAFMVCLYYICSFRLHRAAVQSIPRVRELGVPMWTIKTGGPS